MSLTWEPRWEPIIIEYAGMRIRTCRDRITGMIACPICINAASTCLDLEKEVPRHKKSIELNFFFTERDLIIHLKNHDRVRRIRSRKGVLFSVEEE